MFLQNRGFLWEDVGNYRKAVDALAWAAALMHEFELSRNTLAHRSNAWLRHLNKDKPPRFPPLSVEWEGRRYPKTLPFDLERHVMSIMATENVLRDKQWEEKWWGPMRRGRSVAGTYRRRPGPAGRLPPWSRNGVAPAVHAPARPRH